jgi:RNA polymerase sigma factor (sigma-70 family)
MAAGKSRVRLSGPIRALFGVGALGAMPDAALLEHFVRGAEASEAAFAVLLKRYGPMVMDVCRRVVGDEHLAEDAFQVTFLLLSRRARSIRDYAALGGWLHRTARRVALRVRARIDRRRDREYSSSGAVAIIGPDHRAEGDEIRVIIHEEIDRLGKTLRLPIVLCALEGLTHEEAARRLHWPVGTVKSRLVRGRRRLEGRLARRGLAPGALMAGSVAESSASAVVAVSPALAAATARAAVPLAGGAARAFAVSASTALLFEKELTAMFFTKLKLTAGALLGMSLAVVLIGLALTEPYGPRARGIEPQTVQPPRANPLIVSGATGGASRSVPPAMKLNATGRVVDAGGRPVAGATVLVREWATQRAMGLSANENEKLFRGGEISDVLARGTTDAAGRFRFEEIPAPAFPHAPAAGRTFFPWDLLALAPGHGAAWSQLTLPNQRNVVTLTLPSEGILRGRLVEPGGAPVAGARIKVSGIDRLGHLDPGGLGTDGRLNLLWSSVPLVATSDAGGKFTLRGPPRAIVASLIITDSRHERKVIHAATTKESQPQVTHTTYFHGQPTTEHIPVLTEEFTVTLKPTDHRLAGRVVFAATGKPAPGAQVSVRQRHVAKTDAEGRFLVENLAAGEIELHIIARETDAGPLDMRFSLPDEPKSLEREFVLSAGLVVTGRVVDEQTGDGVGGAELIYRPQVEPGQLPTIFAFLSKSQSDGGFRMVVPAGRGSLEIWKLPSTYPLSLPRPIGGAVEPRFQRMIAGKAGETIPGLTFPLTRGLGITLTVRDLQGQPVAGAEVVRYSLDRPNETVGRTDAAGRYELAGIDRKRGATMDVTHPIRSLGARVDLRPDDDAIKPGGILQVTLQPTGSLRGRVLDEEGKPVRGPVVTLGTDVRYPDRIGPMIETVSEVQQDGSFSFDRLIAGAVYFVEITADGHASIFSERVRAKPGEVQRLKEIRLPVTDQELRGIVVDPRGRWVEGATVSYQRESDRQFVPPRGGRWFQETNAKGEFHLTELPRGRLKLMAYRKPEGADRSITNMVRVEAEAGDGNVWIVLPDPNERLRGIE